MIETLLCGNRGGFSLSKNTRHLFGGTRSPWRLVPHWTSRSAENIDFAFCAGLVLRLPFL